MNNLKLTNSLTRKKETFKPINLDTVASDYLGTNSELYNQILKTTLLAAVGRVKDRGIKFDNCCVLVGRQGTGKSTFWRYLASNDFFSDTWQNRDQDLFMAIQSTWIFEIAELDRINPNGEKAAKLKAEKRKKTPILVGGTGLYFKALTDGLVAIPNISLKLRNQIRNLQKKDLIKQASLSKMNLPAAKAGGQAMKGFKIFVKIKG